VGGLHKYLDLPLIASMARARPDWSWVLVGPAQVSLSQLAKLPNVHLLGEFPHSELAKQIECFDVGIVPYITSTFTETVVPTKINEYLAMGKPVVSTALPAVRDAYGSNGTVLACEPRHDSFISAIEEALQLPTDEAAKTYRRQVAARSDWSSRLELICSLIEKAIEKNSRVSASRPQAHAARA
jgi:glycosyltransferase involved in cell wall biosynthesis